MKDRIEKKRLVILGILKEADTALSSHIITEKMASLGYEISERTVRFHLLAMDKAGLTEYVERHGRKITSLGIMEISQARVFDRVGFLSSKIDQLSYNMTYDLGSESGSVVMNVSLIEKEELKKHLDLLCGVYKAGYGMGTKVSLYFPGDRHGEWEIPEGYVGLGTVCSITVNGVLLSEGIPVRSKFGGLLEIEGHRPVRFVAVINYDGTSLDPMEIFIKGGMTDCRGASLDGHGLVGASFREVPATCAGKILEINERLKTLGLGSRIELGVPGHPLCEIPVNEGNIGMIVKGGLNPVAALEESGTTIASRALSGLEEYDRLFPFEQLKELL